MKDLKTPKFPKAKDSSHKHQENPISNEKKSPSNNEIKQEQSSKIKNDKTFHQEIYEKPVVVFKNLEATVDLNKDESVFKPSEKFASPQFTSSNPSVSLDLDGFKLHGDILNDKFGEESKNFTLHEDINQKVSANLLFLKSVNQMNFETKQHKMDFEIKYEKNEPNPQKIVEITDYTQMSKGILEKPYYIYKICTTIENKIIANVERRYTDFEWLHTYLTNHPKYQGLLIPKLPDKHGIGASFWNYIGSDVEFIKKRKNVYFQI